MRTGLHVQRFSNGGSKSFVYIFTPVLEANIYSMLLAGLGLVGFAARRKLG